MNNFWSSLFNFGVSEQQGDEINLRIRFSNGIFISLPIVYSIFILLDFKSFFVPIHNLAWDQFIVPVFILVSFLCLYLNKIQVTLLSRVIFVVLWPFFLHIVPIMVQKTPSDYYIATPFGVVFHAVLIQAMFSRTHRPIVFYLLMLWNLSMLFYLMHFLVSNDDNGSMIIDVLSSEYFFMDIILYWLIFNLVVFFLIKIIDSNQRRISQSRKVIESQKNEIEETLRRLKRTQSQLIQSEKMASIGTFTAGIAHELNNPMNFIAGGLEMLKRNINDKQAPDEYSLLDAQKIIQQGLDRSSKIIKSLLNLSYPSHTLDSNKHVTQITSVIEDTLLLVVNNRPQNIEIETKFNTNVEIMAYPDKLHQVILNIISNAIDAINELEYKKHETILISTSTVIQNESNYYLIVIRNTGNQIAETTIHRIFDPFFTTKEQGKGTGLGLWISYTLILEHEGDLSVRNTEDGVEFTISIPFDPLV
jgi:signal transduction histidine kinase